MPERVASYVLLALVALAIGNFVLLVTERPVGSALAGRQEGDRYFLSNHGETTEVDRATWEGRRVQEIGVLITFPIAFVAIKFGSGRTGR